MASLNKVQIIGNLGRDPDIRYLQNGDAVASLAVATTEKWKDKNTGEAHEKTEWHRVSFFGKLAEIVGKYLHKGSSIYVEGSLTTRKYTDKDGVEKYATEIKGLSLQMLGGREGAIEGGNAPRQSNNAPRQAAGQQRQEPPRQPAKSSGSGFEDMADDIPF